MYSENSNPSLNSSSNNTQLFNKRTVVELTESEMLEVDGGTTPVCVAAVASSWGCAAGAVVVGAFVVGAVAGYVNG